MNMARLTSGRVYVVNARPCRLQSAVATLIGIHMSNSKHQVIVGKSNENSSSLLLTFEFSNVKFVMRDQSRNLRRGPQKVLYV